ncbi:MFS transporter [Sphingomonas lacunae]|uniref:MFS transporter n=1 Tax=Sphingomonas lacunae TaxID=2698828 RepID=A0A6M4AS10_9SPHN|nr:MFS transporter [Sphingomonas lacunae]QJQ31837.1 MFS transporter [Sphingomonas lacunae]
MSKRPHAILFIVATIFVDAIGFGIIMPVLPQLVMDVANKPLDEAISIGAWIGFAMALASFFAAPILGNLSDAYGRRRVLLIALGGLALDYLLLTVVQTLPWLFIARIISGVVGGSYAAAQAAIADITAPEERARNFGFVGAAFGVGFIAGPVIGGLLGEMGPRAPFIAAAILAGLNFLYGLTLFPETLPPERRRPFDWRRANPLGALNTARAVPGVMAVVVILTLWQVASLVYPLTWTWYAIARFDWTPGIIGASLAGVGVVLALSQIFLTGRAVATLGERNAASVGLVGASGCFLAYAFATQGWMAVAVTPFLAIGALVQPSLMAMLSRRASADTQGEMQGVASMAMGVGSLVAPLLLTGTMARFTGPDAPVDFPGAAFIVSTGFALAALVLLRQLPKASPA